MRAAMFYLGGLLLATTAPLAAEQPASAGAGYAVLVGVCAYEHAGLPPLSYAENDVEALARELDRPGSPFHKRVRVLTTGRGQKNAADRPTAANVKAAVDRALAERTRQETVLVALAGHGVQLLVPDPDGKGEERSYGYFCPADAQLSGVDYRTGRSARLVLLPELLQQLGDCGAGSKLLLMDACRNQLRLKQRSLTIRRDMVPEGVAALFSCRNGEVSYEAEKLRHGVFFHFLLEGLRGKAKNRRGEVTWARLAEYVTEKVTEDAATLLGEKVAQTPHLIANLAGRSPVLAGPGSEAERLYRQGLELYDGTRGKIDREEAARLFRLAAEQGHEGAQMALGVWQTDGAARLNRTDEEAPRWCAKGLSRTRQLAAAGDPDAQRLLGDAYRLGMGTEKNEREAVRWYQQAADQGHAPSQLNLGWCYEWGVGVNKNPSAAFRWYRKAAEADTALGQFYLGRCYEGGLWVSKDEKEAAAWYHKSAAQQYALAQYQLGVLYSSGRGVGKDLAQAVGWLRKAAAQGHAPPQFSLGWCYEQGIEVGKDLEEAKRWYRKAADQGHDEARKRLQQLK
ncbi:MAG: hypothetical protein U0736_21085 [Gemmataceae bacterium]